MPRTKSKPIRHRFEDDNDIDNGYSNGYINGDDNVIGISSIINDNIEEIDDIENNNNNICNNDTNTNIDVNINNDWICSQLHISNSKVDSSNGDILDSINSFRDIDIMVDKYIKDNQCTHLTSCGDNNNNSSSKFELLSIGCHNVCLISSFIFIQNYFFIYICIYVFILILYIYIYIYRFSLIILIILILKLVYILMIIL
jgi:hypothetical protein